MIKPSSLWCSPAVALALWGGLVIASSLVSPARASPISYAGRLVDASGAPREGTVDLEVSFYDAAEGGSKLGNSPYAFAATPLAQGNFNLAIELSDADAAAIFRDTNAAVWIEVTDKSEARAYPRQRLTVVPFALRVPVDGATLAFDASGQLTVLSAPGAGTVPNPLPAVDGAALTNVDAASLRGSPVTGAAPSVGQVLKWNGAAWAPAADVDTTNPGTVTSIVAGSGLTGGTITGSGTLAVDAGTGANQIVRLDAAAKLPAVDGSALTAINAARLQTTLVDTTAPAASQVLKYDGTKWAPAADANSGGTVTAITAGNGLTGGTITGSGTLALASPMPALDGGALTNVNAVKLQGRTVSGTAPANGHVLKWNASASSWEAAPDDGGVAGAISSGQNLGASDATTADVYESTSAPSMRFRRLKAGTGVALTQNADDVTLAVAAGGISATELAVDAVGSDEIAADAVTSSEIAADAVTANEIATDAVGSSEIAAGAVGNAELAADAVTSAKIQDGQIQTADLAANAVTTSEILNGTITGADLSSSAALSVASVGVNAQAGLSLSPYGTAAGSTGEARFEELAANGTNFVALRSPDALAADVTYTLPSAAPTANGQILSGTTAGELSWTSLPTALPPSGAAGGDLTGTFPNPTLAASSVSSTAIADGTIVNADISGTAALATSKLSGAVTAISGHGLGSLATLSAVSSAEIVDATIANADIAGSAAIATSKLSGALTAVSGHGLGSLASLSTVGSTEISDSAITNADISGTAAISSTKISFVAASISGNAVDGGVVSNFQSTGIDDNATSIAMTLNLSGNVGIGTTSPNSILDVSSGVSGGVANVVKFRNSINASNSQAQIDFAFGGASASETRGAISGLVKTSGAGNLLFKAFDPGNGGLQEKMRIDESGNVGIGTTAPRAGLEIAGPSNYSLMLAGTAAGVNPAIRWNLDTTTFSTIAVARATGQYGALNSGDFIVRSEDTSTLLAFFNGNSFGAGLTINSNNVGIGVTSPQNKLDVEGAMAIGAAYSGASAAPSNGLIVQGNVGIGTTAPGQKLVVSTVAGSETFMSTDATTGYVGTLTNQKLILQTNNLNRMTIDTAGNVGIGTTNPTHSISYISTARVLGITGDASASTQSIGVLSLANNRATATSSDKTGQFDFASLANSGDKRSASIVSNLEGAGGTNGFGGNLQILTKADNGVLTERIRINHQGNVGIGTTVPSTTLDVRGPLGAPATSGTTQTGIFSVQSSSTAGNVLYFGGYTASPYGLWLQASDRSNLAINYPIVLQPNGGNIGIGTTSPVAALDVGSGKVAMGWERIANACGNTTICTATCSAGKKALGGGCRLANTWARQTEEPADSSYTCYTDATTTLTAHVYCANMQ